METPQEFVYALHVCISSPSSCASYRIKIALARAAIPAKLTMHIDRQKYRVYNTHFHSSVQLWSSFRGTQFKNNLYTMYSMLLWMYYICCNMNKNTGYKLDICHSTDVMTMSYVGLVRLENVGIKIVVINPHQTVGIILIIVTSGVIMSGV